MNVYIDDFINYIRTIRNYSDYTETNYLLDLDNYEEFLKKNRINFKKISYNDITKYNKYLKEDLKLSSSSIARHLSSLRSFYNYLLSENIVSDNPFKLVSSPKKEMKLPNYMKYKEFEEMINTCDDSILGIRNSASFGPFQLVLLGLSIFPLINHKNCYLCFGGLLIHDENVLLQISIFLHCLNMKKK